MAITSSFKFTNTTEGEYPTPQVLLGLTSNYAVSADKANQTVLNNKTAPIDAQEIISIQSRNLPKVDSNLNIQNPSPNKGGIQYGVQVEETLVTTDSANPAFRIDNPVVAWIGIRHTKSGDITNDIIGQVVERLISACKRADGTWRFDDFMRSAERPVTD